MSEPVEAAVPVEPDLHSPTDLAFFGRPDVTLVPKLITSAHRRLASNSLVWVGEIGIICDGVEIVPRFNSKAQWEACYRWVRQCILVNHATTRISTPLSISGAAR
jgi:hypothetical protein